MMGKDFRVGLMTGVVLAVVALIWVATRPSLSPRARIAPAGAAPSGVEPAGDDSSPWETQDAVRTALGATSELPTPAEAADRQEPQETAQPPEGVSAEPAMPPAMPDLTAHEMSEPIKTTRFHIVRKGETLSAIAQQYYGSSDRWRKIVTANQKAIKDPNRISPGTKLTIPD